MCLLGDTGLASLPKLAGLLKDYGIEGADGYIADPQRCYQNQPYYIFPVMNLSGDMADGISSQMVLLMNSRGLTTTDPARDTITTSAFMTTSEQAYAVTEEDQKQERMIWEWLQLKLSVPTVTHPMIPHPTAILPQILHQTTVLRAKRAD